MLAKNVTQPDLDKALEATNKLYAGNIVFKAIRSAGGTRVRFTLTVKDSRGPGSRFSLNQSGKVRRVRAACFHAHGHLFQHLLEAKPDAVIETREGKITSMGGNWVDFPKGLVMASQSCDCMKGKL